MEEEGAETIYSHPHRKKKKRSTTSTTTKAENDWTEENDQIVEGWKKSLQEASFVYNDTSEYYERLLQMAVVLSLVLGVCITLVSTLTITLGATNYPWVVLGLNIGMVVASSVIAIANGLEKILSWDEKQKRYGDHSLRLYSLWLTLGTFVRFFLEKKETLTTTTTNLRYGNITHKGSTFQCL
jgi:hypothetical protein